MGSSAEDKSCAPTDAARRGAPDRAVWCGPVSLDERREARA
jgi:hypothetical protein